MSNIWVSVTGAGYAYVDNPQPVDGDVITLYCTPDPGETLDDVTATDYQGYAIALATVPVQTFTYQAAWNDMYINVVFSGSPGPTPPPSWLWAILKIGKIRRRKRAL